MLKFSEILFEAAAKKEKEFNLNDAKGKLFEILAGSHLQHGTDAKTGMPSRFLEHFRSDEGTPEEVHRKIKDELERRGQGHLYNEISGHAREAAQHLRDQLAAHGHTKIHRVAWTSKKDELRNGVKIEGDHQRFTGVHDPNSDADLMVHTEHGPVGLSLKYGETKDMNLRNPGLKTWEDDAGLKPGELSELRSQHAKRMQALGIKNHKHFKQIMNDPAFSNVVDQAMESANSTQKQIAQRVANGLARKSEQDPEFLRSYIKKAVSPPTTFQHFRLHTRPDGKGGASHHFSDMQDDASRLDQYDNLRVVPHNGDSISFRIQGTRRGSNKPETVFTQLVRRGGTGPMKGFAGSTTAPYLTKSDDNRGALELPKKPITTAQTAPAPAPAAAPVVRKKPAAPRDAFSGTNSPVANWTGAANPHGEYSGQSHGGTWNDKDV